MSRKRKIRTESGLWKPLISERSDEVHRSEMLNADGQSWRNALMGVPDEADESSTLLTKTKVDSFVAEHLITSKCL